LLENEEMKELSFEVTFTDEMLEILNEHLKKSKKLKKLSLQNSGLNTDGLEILLKGLKKNEILESLSLKYNEISEEEDFEKLAGYLEKNKSLKHLDLSENDFESLSLQPIINALHLNNTLVSLNTCRNEVHDCFLDPNEDNRSEEELKIEFLLRCNDPFDPKHKSYFFEPFVNSFCCFLMCNKDLKFPKPICLKILGKQEFVIF
jgi:hypothetical protein